ncbi:uncharacterized protein LOC129583101 [Paramacrobiotus metropolitanus]|uniref:uncharacterized protein LOC129583101 n=1 Tax=Paramacrobiotus metropolitanus TaxID=2943436 RepID=UPI00244617DB|nr:uncharacterized protein LOC129583101 [Paramacrobiotus metropolitanus]
MGAPYSEQLGLNPDEKSDNGIYINTVPFDEPQHERPDWLLEVVFIHEILHGVFDIRHEHTRADRDQYMKLFSSNLMCNNPMDPNNNLHYFEKNDPTAPHFSSDMKMPYDPRSIMHSGFDDYSRRVDGTPLTTVQLQPGMPLFWVAGPIRETPRLRFFDVEKMRTRYKCPRQNRELLKETRETYFLFKWIVDCEGDPYQLENYLSPAELTNRNMIEKCARLAENYGVLATLNLTGKSCNVHDSLANCQYKPHSSGDVAIIGRSNRLLRTFDKKVIVQAGSKPVSQISGALLRDLLSGECQALCQLMPGICVAATEINKGNTHQCQLYSQWPTRFTNTMDPAVTTYVVEDWDRMPIDDYNSLA